MKSNLLLTAKIIALTAFFQIASLLVINNFSYVINDKLIVGAMGSNAIAIFLSVIILIAALFVLNTRSLFFVLFAAGIISNVLDRFLYRGVVDYIKLPFWPIFNLADVAVCVGVIAVLFLTIKKESA